MIVTATAGKIDALIGRFEGPLMAFLAREEDDFAKDSIKNKRIVTGKQIGRAHV